MAITKSFSPTAAATTTTTTTVNKPRAIKNYHKINFSATKQSQINFSATKINFSSTNWHGSTTSRPLGSARQGLAAGFMTAMVDSCFVAWQAGWVSPSRFGQWAGLRFAVWPVGWVSCGWWWWLASQVVVVLQI